jgi:pyruvate/2-oxoglutarate/acetoin dehydrogenase E1 component
VGVLLVIYIALVLYLNMRKENILSFAYQEVEIKKEGDSILVIGYGLGCARAKEYADSLAKESIPSKLQLVEPIYSAEDYLHNRYGIFYPKF